MSQQTSNRATVPAGSDPWNLVADMKKAIETSGLVIPVSSDADRDALPSSIKVAGCIVSRLDKPGVTEIYDGTKWWKHGGPMHAEFTGSTVPDIPTTSPLWGSGPLSYQSAASINGGFATSPSNDRIALPVGVYEVWWRFSMSVNATGTTWGTITNDANTNTFASADIPTGYSTATAIRTALYLTTAQNVRFVFYSANASGYTLTSRITVFKKA